MFEDTIDDARDVGIAGSDQASYPALGFNPTPGNAGTVSSLADTFGTVASHLGQAHEAITKAGQCGGFWQGEAAQNFHDKIGELPDYLDKANRSLGDASTALAGWSSDLTSMQQTAKDYEAQAEKALQRVDTANANPDLQLAGQHFDTDDALRSAQQRLNAASGELDAANSELSAIRDQAKRLFEQHQDLVEEAADALRKAKDIAPDEPGFFDKLGEALGDIVDGIKDLAGKVGKFISEHADLIAKIGDVLSDVTAVLATIALVTAPFEPVGAVFAAAATVTGAGALAAHGIAKAGGADVSWGKIGLDAIGVVPGVGALAKGGKAGITAARTAARAGESAVSAGAREFSTVAKAANAKNVAEGPLLGTGGLSKVLPRIGKGHLLDSIGDAGKWGQSATGVAINAGTKVTTTVGGKIYSHVTDD